MTDDRSLERAARSWIQAGPTTAPDRAIEAALLRIESTPQIRDFEIPWRLPRMMTPARLAMASAVSVLLIGGFLLLGRPSQPSVGPSLTTPEPTSKASMTSSPPPPEPSSDSSSQSLAEQLQKGKNRWLAPGIFGSPSTLIDATDFVVPFRMTWDTPVASKGNIDIVDISIADGGVHAFRADFVGQDPCHTNDLRADPLQTPQQFMDWLASIPGATVEPVSRVVVDGHEGLSRILSVGDLAGCFDTFHLHSGILHGQYGTEHGGFFLVAGERERWVSLDVDGHLIAIVIERVQDESLSAAADHALGTIVFSRGDRPRSVDTGTRPGK
jgi:hypothetical protein